MKIVLVTSIATIAFCLAASSCDASEAYLNQIYSTPAVSVKTPAIEAHLPDLNLVVPAPSIRVSDLMLNLAGYTIPVALGAENSSDVLQVGDNNSASAFQSGFGNAGLISQTGANNFAQAFQLGHGNGSAIYQSGQNFHATVAQLGNGNHALVVQTH